MPSCISSLSIVLLLRLSSLVTAFKALENPMRLNSEFNSRLVVKPKYDIQTTTGENVDSANQLVLTTYVNRRDPAVKLWKINKSNIDKQYWYHPMIHSFGNIGFFGAVHAALAPISTKVIDVVAYDGQSVRETVAKTLAEKVVNVKKAKGRRTRVLDMCCGTGISTRALQDVFPESDSVFGVDTSPEMLTMARFLTSHVDFFKTSSLFSLLTSNSSTSQRPNNLMHRKISNKAKFAFGNAEKTGFPNESFELVTVMYAFHEIPLAGRKRVLKEAHRVLQPGGTLAVIDICTDYKPSQSMLMGEPYILEYQKNIHRQMRTITGFSNRRYETIVKNHVGMWTLKRNNI